MENIARDLILYYIVLLEMVLLGKQSIVLLYLRSGESENKMQQVFTAIVKKR